MAEADACSVIAIALCQAEKALFLTMRRIDCCMPNLAASPAQRPVHAAAKKAISYQSRLSAIEARRHRVLA